MPSETPAGKSPAYPGLRPAPKVPCRQWACLAEPCGTAVLRLLFPMRTGVHENRDLPRHSVLPAQLFCSALRELGDGFDQVLQTRDRAPETARIGNLFLGRRLTDKARTDLAGVIGRAVVDGKNPKAVRTEIMQVLDDQDREPRSMPRPKSPARCVRRVGPKPLQPRPNLASRPPCCGRRPRFRPPVPGTPAETARPTAPQR